MSVSLSIVILCEVLSTLLIVWGFMHEEKLVAFEDKIIRFVLRKFRKTRRTIKVAKLRFCAQSLKKEGFTVSRERKDS